MVFVMMSLLEMLLLAIFVLVMSMLLMPMFLMATLFIFHFKLAHTHKKDTQKKTLTFLYPCSSWNEPCFSSNAESPSSSKNFFFFSYSSNLCTSCLPLVEWPFLKPPFSWNLCPFSPFSPFLCSWW